MRVRVRDRERVEIDRVCPTPKWALATQICHTQAETEGIILKKRIAEYNEITEDMNRWP